MHCEGHSGSELRISLTLMAAAFGGDAHINSSHRADRCAICDQPLTIAPTVAMRGGGAVHIACADQEAQTAWRQRWRAALRDLILLAVGSVLLWWSGIALWSVALGAIVGLIAHAIRHRRFWHYVRRDLAQLRLHR